MRRRIPYRRFRGFTLLELIVTLSIVAILAALAIPAVQRSRETSRNVTCKSNLRQIGQATHNYADAHGGIDGDTPLRSLLPFVEQSQLLATLESSGPNDPIAGRVPLYACPSDPYIDLGQLHTSYEMNAGTTGGNGIARSTMRRWRDVSDGLSHTALYAEQLMWLPVYYLGSWNGLDWEGLGRSEPNRFYWHIDKPFADGFDFLELAEYCLDTSHHTSVLPLYVDTNRSVRHPNIDIGYNHLIPPNAVPCTHGPASEEFVVIHGGETRPPSSLHGDGANVLLCDGSVRFISRHIDLNTWWALGTRAEGDQVGEF